MVNLVVLETDSNTIKNDKNSMSNAKKTKNKKKNTKNGLKCHRHQKAGEVKDVMCWDRI